MKCPVCLSIDPGTSCHQTTEVEFQCEVCGRYATDLDLALQARDGAVDTGNWELTKLQRAVLSHRIRVKHDHEVNQSSANWFRVSSHTLDDLRSQARQPTPAEQAKKAIRYIGDHLRSQDQMTVRELPYGFRAAIGAADYAGGVWVVEELESAGAVKFRRKEHEPFPVVGGSLTIRPTLRWITLTLEGWQKYQRGKREGFQGNYGFVALQFNNAELNQFMVAVKSIVREKTGYDLVDMNDVQEPGVIDNIMRGQIDGAAFVLADLTDENAGAYWESGYAEGLGKPVVYMCRRDKFDERGTHFDTNHCTTIMWTADAPEAFCDRLIATLRRSIEGL